MELLDLALADPVTPISTKAFTIFTIHNDKVLAEISDHIEEYAGRIFESGNSILLNRLGLITQAVCFHSPENMLTKCPYIPSFLRFCHNRSIYDMFDCFMTSKPILRTHLSSIGLANEVLRIIAEAVPGDGDMICGVFKLISLIHSHSEFAETITSPDAMAVMTREFPGASTILLANQWSAVSLCVTKDNAHVLIDQFQRLLVLLQGETPVFYAHQEAIIKVFSVILSHVPEFEGLLLQADICAIFVGIMNSYPSHAIAHNAIGKFFADHIHSERIASSLLHALFPLVLDGMRPGSSTIYRAFAWNILKKIEEAGVLTDYITENFASNEELMARFTELSKIISTDYGGEIDTAEEDAMSSEHMQIIALFRMIASKQRG